MRLHRFIYELECPINITSLAIVDPPYFGNYGKEGELYRFRYFPQQEYVDKQKRLNFGEYQIIIF